MTRSDASELVELLEKLDQRMARLEAKSDENEQLKADIRGLRATLGGLTGSFDALCHVLDIRDVATRAEIAVSIKNLAEQAAEKNPTDPAERMALYVMGCIAEVISPTPKTPKENPWKAKFPLTIVQ